MMQLDKRIREDIIRQMEELACSYTPEWKYHAEQGDVGAALVNIYGDMLVEMIRRYNLTPERDKQVFFQKIGTIQRQAEPAQGYVSFGMVNREVRGSRVPSGTGLLGTTSHGEQVRFETCKEIYVSNSEIKRVFYQDGSRDHIYCLAQSQGELADSDPENLQEHVCWLGHASVFHIRGEAEILISLIPGRGECDWNHLIEDKDKTGFSYMSVQGEWQFEEWSCKDAVIRLRKTAEMPDFAPVEVQNKNCCLLKWTAKDIQTYMHFKTDGILVGAVGADMHPQYVYTANGQEVQHHFFPFGERPYAYGECYICSDEVFEKKGAVIGISLDIAFHKIPLLTEPVLPPIQWKTIMRQSDFLKEEVLPITVGEVVWEYYNGTGFTRLFTEPLYADAFSPNCQNAYDLEEKDLKKVTISFICPENMEPVLVNSSVVHCIRARILRINHAYSGNGFYITPLILNMKLSFDYRSSMQRPGFCKVCNHLEEDFPDAGQVFAPFLGPKEMRPTLYIGFDRPLLGGPYGLYCGVNQGMTCNRGVKWNYEYFNGREWVSLMLEDNTENLTKSGILMLYGNEEFDAVPLFGNRLFWMRIIALHDDTGECGKGIPVKELWMNTVPVLAVETAPEEFFVITESKESPVCRLKQNNIQRISVWVNESALSPKEQAQLERETEVERIRDEAGVVSAVWVLWEEVDDIHSSRPGQRHYSIDRREGIVTFPQGVQGFLSGSRRECQVKVVYAWGGGSKGNLEEGQITHLRRSIRFLNQVVNRHKLSGGRNQELQEEAITRMERQLRHNNRAVMLSDYEALALEAAREAAKVKAFSNRNEMGGRQRGAITLVVLPEDYQNADFQKIKEAIYEYIWGRMPAIRQLQSHLYIVKPWFMEVQVSAVCIIKAHGSVFACEAEARERLRRFLNPLTGNFDGQGWNIGQAPNREQLLNALSKTRGMERVKKMAVKAYCRRDGRTHEIDLEGEVPEFSVVINGTHRLSMEFFDDVMEVKGVDK